MNVHSFQNWFMHFQENGRIVIAGSNDKMLATLIPGLDQKF